MTSMWSADTAEPVSTGPTQNDSKTFQLNPPFRPAIRHRSGLQPPFVGRPLPPPLLPLSTSPSLSTTCLHMCFILVPVIRCPEDRYLFSITCRRLTSPARWSVNDPATRVLRHYPVQFYEFLRPVNLSLDPPLPSTPHPIAPHPLPSPTRHNLWLGGETDQTDPVRPCQNRSGPTLYRQTRPCHNPPDQTHRLRPGSTRPGSTRPDLSRTGRSGQ